MMTQNLIDKVNSFTQEKALFALPATVVVGVSGGADSMALLHILHRRAAEGLTVYAVHIHHGLRGEEADRDERLVRAFCTQHNIPLYVEHTDVQAMADVWGCGIEEAGRRVRYAAFERQRRAVNAAAIATAHTADDVTETVLMHIARGCGGSGLGGIPAKRGYIVRPMLNCTRAEIEAYCAAENVPYIVDSSNTDISYTRNRVRHELLPVLRRINPAVDKALCRLSSAAAQDEAYFNALAAKVLAAARLYDGVYARDCFFQQPQPVRVRLWRMLLMEYGCFSFAQPHIDALENALKNNRGVVYLPNNKQITISANQIMVYTVSEKTKFCVSIEALPFETVINGVTHRLEVFSGEEYNSFQNVHKKFFKLTLDYDRIQGGLTLRCRCEGDFIHLAARNITKTLKKLMQEYGVPAHKREFHPLICDDNGVLAVAAIGCDSRVNPNDSTKHFLVWSMQGEPSYEKVLPDGTR